ncbi:MAG TPA: HAD hydrolase-like protein, partial [Terrimicrobiaceae bacterium]|nr:HAD hydrolase-like protein [Terrimicrobiaceae bacterium]
KQHVSAAEILFVGDETRDIEACQKVGVRIVAVTWGYNSRRSLVAMKPDFIFDDPKELVALMVNPTVQPIAQSNPPMAGTESPAHQATALP